MSTLTVSDLPRIGRPAALSLAALLLSSCMLVGSYQGGIRLKQVGQALPATVETQGASIGRLLIWQGEVVALLASSIGGNFAASPEELVFSSLEGELGSFKFHRVIDCLEPVLYKGHRTDAAGRLLMIASCSRSKDGKYIENIVRYDPLTSTTRVISRNVLPIVDSNYVSPRKDGEAFVLTFGTLYGGLYIVDEAGAHPIDSEVKGSGSKL